MLQWIIFDLFNWVKINCVVVGAEFFALEEVDGSLVKLKHHDLVEKVKALDVSISPLDWLR